MFKLAIVLESSYEAILRSCANWIYCFLYKSVVRFPAIVYCMNLFLVELKLELYFLLGAVAFMAGWVPCIVWASYLLKAVSGS